MVFASLINISDRYRLFEWGVVYIILSLGFLWRNVLGLVVRPEHNSELPRMVYGNRNIIASANLSNYLAVPINDVLEA
jgi:hypothetical protein